MLLSAVRAEKADAAPASIGPKEVPNMARTRRLPSEALRIGCGATRHFAI